MTHFNFSLGCNTFDNRPDQRSAVSFDDFITQISKTGSKKKGEYYICSALSLGLHDDPARYQGTGHWRLKRLALPRTFLALDADYFSAIADFTAFCEIVSQWNALVYTTASHSVLAPRARAIIELDRAVGPEDGIAIGNAVQPQIEAKLGVSHIKLDPCVYQATQPVYTPLVTAELYRTHGSALDVAGTLAAWPAPSIGDIGWLQPPGYVPPANFSALTATLILPPEVPAEIAKVRVALSHVSADCPYPEWRDILFALNWTQWSCAEQLARSWSMTAPNRYDPAVFDNVWRHAKPFGQVTLGTLFHQAKMNGAAITSSQSGVTQNAAPKAFEENAIINIASGRLTILTTPPPPRKYIFGKVVVPGSVAVMAGVGGTAKTTLALQIAIHGAVGHRLGSIEVSEFASLLFLGEETTEERDRRFGALCSDLSEAERAQVETNVYCHAAAGDDLRTTIMVGGNVEETILVDLIANLAKQHSRRANKVVGLIVLDHARLVMAGDPLSADHVTALVRALTRIAVETGAAVLLLAHSPKSTYAKEGEADPSEVFGSGAFVDHTRAAFVLHTMREKEAKHFGLSDADRKDHICLNVVKANYGPSGTSWWFKKEAVVGWQAIKLESVYLLPKNQMATQSQLSRRIIDLIKSMPGQISERALRDKYSGLNGKLEASEADVKRTLQRQLDEGTLIRRAPTDDERKLYRLSHNVKETLDLPEMAV